MSIKFVNQFFDYNFKGLKKDPVTNIDEAIFGSMKVINLLDFDLFSLKINTFCLILIDFRKP